MRKLLSNNHADMNMIISAVIMAIMFAIGIIVVFNVIGGISGSLTELDGELAEAVGLSAGVGTDLNGTSSDWEQYNATTVASNATSDLTSNVETFFTVGPIALIVVAAVGILSYVMLLRRR